MNQSEASEAIWENLILKKRKKEQKEQEKKASVG